MKSTNIITSFLIGAVFGFTAAVIGMNLHAHTEIAKDPSITLKSYWDGDTK